MVSFGWRPDLQGVVKFVSKCLAIYLGIYHDIDPGECRHLISPKWLEELLSALSLSGQVTIGQKCGQAQRSRSWCLWDARTDGAVSECYENESMFCICQVCRKWQVSGRRH